MAKITEEEWRKLAEREWQRNQVERMFDPEYEAIQSPLEDMKKRQEKEWNDFVRDWRSLCDEMNANFRAESAVIKRPVLELERDLDKLDCNLKTDSVIKVRTAINGWKKLGLNLDEARQRKDELSKTLVAKDNDKWHRERERLESMYDEAQRRINELVNIHNAKADVFNAEWKLKEDELLFRQKTELEDLKACLRPKLKEVLGLYRSYLKDVA